MRLCYSEFEIEDSEIREIDDDFYKIVSYHTVVIAAAVKRIRSPYCVVLTGTPLETVALVSSITEKDAKTGQTYLKIP